MDAAVLHAPEELAASAADKYEIKAMLYRSFGNQDEIKKLSIGSDECTYGPVVKSIAWHSHSGSLPNLIAFADAGD